MENKLLRGRLETGVIELCMAPFCLKLAGMAALRGPAWTGLRTPKEDETPRCRTVVWNTHLCDSEAESAGEAIAADLVAHTADGPDQGAESQFCRFDMQAGSPYDQEQVAFQREFRFGFSTLRSFSRLAA